MSRAGANCSDGAFEPKDIVRYNETTTDALAVKADFVLGLMEQRLQGLGVSWSRVSITNVYTIHDVNAMLANLVLPRIGSAAQHGVN